MVITAHFVGNDWKLNKRIINFCKISSHKGPDIAASIVKCLEGWGLKSIFSITVDNAAGNDNAITVLKEKFTTWGTSVVGGKYLHMRCVAHVVNLIVSDGLEEIGISVRRVREAVRWVRASSSRLDSFKNCVAWYKIESRKMLCSDVATRWNSTYFMIEVAQVYEKAFSLLGRDDPNYEADLKNRTYKCKVQNKDVSIGSPKPEDWMNVRLLSRYLKFFHELTLLVSGTSYVTVHLFLREMCRIFITLSRLEGSEDKEIKGMDVRMHEKVAKYWSEEFADNKRFNRLFYIAIFLDPRHKYDYPEYVFKRVYGDKRGGDLLGLLKEEMKVLFEEYKTLYMTQNENHPTSNEAQTAAADAKSEMVDEFDDDGYTPKQGSGGRSELETYMLEHPEDDEGNGANFDILNWWMQNSIRYPILSMLARDVLVVPISTVASEFAFSTGGRVLDSFRSSLTPTIVEALICSEDWLRSSKSSLVPDIEDLEEQEEFEKGLEAVVNSLGLETFGAGGNHKGEDVVPKPAESNAEI